MSSSEITTPQSFEQKLKARIKDSVSDLISDEDLSKLIKGSLEDVFTKPRLNPKYSSYGYGANQPPTIEPFIHELIKDLLQPTVTEVIQKYIQDNPSVITAVIGPIVQEGAGKAIMAAISSMLSNDMITLQNNLLNSLQTRR